MSFETKKNIITDKIVSLDSKLKLNPDKTIINLDLKSKNKLKTLRNKFEQISLI